MIILLNKSSFLNVFKSDFLQIKNLSELMTTFINTFNYWHKIQLFKFDSFCLVYQLGCRSIESNPVSKLWNKHLTLMTNEQLIILKLIFDQFSYSMEWKWTHVYKQNNYQLMINGIALFLAETSSFYTK